MGRFWDAPNLAETEGLKAVAMFDAIAAGQIKALWVMGTNPAVTLPRADAVRDALAALEFLVVSENVASNDTVNLAHVRLPAAAWGEKDGTVTNSERRISRQRPFLELPGEARPDWWILSQVATRFGWGKSFAYGSAADVFREHASLSGFDNGGARLFDISALASLSEEDYDQLAPVQWPQRAGQSRGTERLFGDGRFAFPSRKARFVPIVRGKLWQATSESWPFVLNTGRVRDQWHTMTRTGLSPRLAVHVSEPFVEVHPNEALALGLAQGALARVTTQHGACVLKVMHSEAQQKGSLFVPMHWSAENSSAGRIGALVHPATDPISGQPEAKGTPARIEALPMTHFGFALARCPLSLHGTAYWARSRMPAGEAAYFALDAAPLSWRDWSARLLPDGEWLTYEDTATEQFRAAVIRDGRLEAVIYAARQPELPSTEWLKTAFGPTSLSAQDRRALLAGRPIGGVEEGPIVCACFQVGLQRIAAAVAKGAATPRAIGIATRAGTNCGSCLPELKRLAGSVRLPAAAE